MPVHVLKEANRCLQCKKPRCRELGCPIQTNIPEVIRLFKENKMMEAAEILFENNPLSVVCSLVCNHEGQCEGHCIKGMKGEPVHFSSIENYISDSCFERLDLSCAPPNGMKVGVVGAGPAGITIAIILARRGYKVTVFEGREKIGGILRYGIPEFRLPKSILDRYYKRMRECVRWAFCSARTSTSADRPAYRIFWMTATPASSSEPVRGDRASSAFRARHLATSSTRSIICTIPMSMNSVSG